MPNDNNDDKIWTHGDLSADDIPEFAKGLADFAAGMISGPTHPDRKRRADQLAGAAQYILGTQWEFERTGARETMSVFQNPRLRKDLTGEERDAMLKVGDARLLLRKIAEGEIKNDASQNLITIAAALRNAPTPTDAGNGAGELVLDPDGMKILQALAKSATTQNQYAIGETCELSRKTISVRLATLREAGLTHRPHGDHGGEAITPKGRAKITQ